MNTGWVRRNVVDTTRLEELVGTYESLGFEVQVRTLDPADSKEHCTECMAACPEKNNVIWTRKKSD